MATRADKAGRSRADGRAAEKLRRQKMFIGVGGVALLGLVGFQLSGLIGSSSSAPLQATARSAPPPAVPVGKQSRGSSTGSPSPVPRSIARLEARDLFVPQISSGAGLTAVAGNSVTPKAPAVRGRGFVSKDPFVPQVTVPSAPRLSPATGSAVGGGTGSAPAGVQDGGTYIVVLGLIPGNDKASEKAAGRAVVAAKNAGLKDVTANDIMPGTSTGGAHFTVFTGPYPSAAMAHTELLRALRNGYPGAHTEQIPSSSGGGF